jgi:hypothetical protein
MRAIDPRIFHDLSPDQQQQIRDWLPTIRVDFDQTHLIADSDQPGFTMVCFYNTNVDGRRYLAGKDQASQRCVLTRTPDWLEAIYEAL